MAKSNSSPCQLFGLLGDIIKLSAVTVGAGIKVTCEASAKARPHIQALSAKVQKFSLDKGQEAKEPEAQPTALIVAPAQQ
jgi:hypothetical protein